MILKYTNIGIEISHVTMPQHNTIFVYCTNNSACIVAATNDLGWTKLSDLELIHMTVDLDLSIIHVVISNDSNEWESNN